ncbi:Uncharacterised protein [Vibrio cholerae]|nr:Uncharacterised protein [Vibrio cholerae]CSC92526.1 Uncharacterised protein [Vibrio cholerae]CSI52224.1 Uncharacterised protein [Vibrio cholerae]
MLVGTGLNLPLRCKSEAITAETSSGNLVAPSHLKGTIAIGRAESIPSVITSSNAAFAILEKPVPMSIKTKTNRLNTSLPFLIQVLRLN